MIDYKKCFICDRNLSLRDACIYDCNYAKDLYEYNIAPDEHEYLYEIGTNPIFAGNYIYIGVNIENIVYRLYFDYGVFLTQNSHLSNSHHLYKNDFGTLEEEFEFFANILKDKNINKLKKLIMIL